MDSLQAYINFEVVAFCLIIGGNIKSSRLNNNVIPFLLMVIGAIISLMINGLNTNAVLVGVYSAWISTGIHSTGNGVRKLYRDDEKY